MEGMGVSAAIAGTAGRVPFLAVPRAIAYNLDAIRPPTDYRLSV